VNQISNNYLLLKEKYQGNTYPQRRESISTNEDPKCKKYKVTQVILQALTHPITNGSVTPENIDAF
jgi:hypothetical protein